MRHTLYLSLVAALCLVAGNARAEEMEHEESGLQFTLPDGWTHEQQEDMLIATSPDEGVEVAFIVSEADTTEELMDVITSELDEVIKGAKTTKDVTEEKVNNLTQIYAEGTGQCEGEPCDWDLTLVVGAKKNLIVLAVGEIDANQKAITRLYNSIKKAKFAKAE